MPNKIKVNGAKIDLSKDEKMLVNDNSMKYYNLFDGQRIYVKRFSDNEKSNITTYPVLVFNIDNPKSNDTEYKLRKFVGYVDSDNWQDIFNHFRERIKISETDFVTQCAAKYAKTPSTDRAHLVLSETFDEDKASIAYSLHPVTSVFGKVEYALWEEAFVMEKFKKTCRLDEAIRASHEDTLFETNDLHNPYGKLEVVRYSV